ncbi:hypothetical protein BVC80_525g6 [Macleaya cordata]|uniref:Transposase n=1 Tax=Macleaya cordata TaxID=56857 RepID=A0A200R920_MACCD|nr:hypothetical protein BVC80_525g6 [Macleaya cordata]
MEEVKLHLFTKGIDKRYRMWALHGEKSTNMMVELSMGEHVEEGNLPKENTEDERLRMGNFVDVACGVHEGVDENEHALSRLSGRQVLKKLSKVKYIPDKLNKHTGTKRKRHIDDGDDDIEVDIEVEVDAVESSISGSGGGGGGGDVVIKAFYKKAIKECKNIPSNKRYVEGSIAESYLVSESVRYAMEYMPNTQDRNHKATWEAFLEEGSEYSDEGPMLEHTNVLLRPEQFIQIRRWLLEEKKTDSELWRYVKGPLAQAKAYKKYRVNGFIFSPKSHDDTVATQDSGVCMEATTTFRASRKDKNPINQVTKWYGVIKQILEVNYTDFMEIVFYYDWVKVEDKNNGQNSSGTPVPASQSSSQTNASEGTKPKTLITVDPNGRPVGELSEKFSTRVGELVRVHCPVSYKDWRLFPKNFKKDVWNALMFEFEFNVPSQLVREHVENSYPQKFRSCKNTLRKEHLDGNTKEEALAACPIGFNPNTWKDFVENEYKDEMKKKRAQNSENKKKSTICHTLGRRSYLNKNYILAKKEGIVNEDRAASWMKGHERKDGTVHPTATMMQQWQSMAATRANVGDGTPSPKTGSNSEHHTFRMNLNSMFEGELREDMNSGSRVIENASVNLLNRDGIVVGRGYIVTGKDGEVCHGRKVLPGEKKVRIEHVDDIHAPLPDAPQCDGHYTLGGFSEGGDDENGETVEYRVSVKATTTPTLNKNPNDAKSVKTNSFTKKSSGTTDTSRIVKVHLKFPPKPIVSSSAKDLISQAQGWISFLELMSLVKESQGF